jgi:AraC-like DNA-binding protein
VKNLTRCFSLDVAGRVGVLQARYYGRAFSPHWHEEYAIGLITGGVEQFEYRGATHRAGIGEIILMDAGEVHTGESWDERGFAFRMLYIPESTFREAAAETWTVSGTLSFRDPVISDDSLRKALSNLHGILDSRISALEREALFLNAAAKILERAGSWKNSVADIPAPLAVQRARDYLLDHLFADISLDLLASVSGLSKFHLLRQFRAEFGLPPHSYQLQHRIIRAKTLLRSLAPVEVAMTCGFADQSHFHRVFRSLVGTTPGCYAEQFRSRRSISTPILSI